MWKFLLLLVTLFAVSGCDKTKEVDNFILVKNSNGPVLGYSPASGVHIITDNGMKFKDLNRNGQLDPYEDWRLPAETRAKDLASVMSIEQIAGLMLYSSHQSVPSDGKGYGKGKYGGKSFAESGVDAWELTDEQQLFLADDNLRHVLVTALQNSEVASRWNNRVQALVEGIGWGIPCNTCSDPRHGAANDAEFNAGAGGDISQWPDGLAMAATFDPELVRQFGEIASKEYRALGISTTLSPQVDLGTEPRWFRISMTFGESPALTTDMARAYIDGFQTSEGNKEIADGWGYESVNAMVKHWPGGGSGESGRDSHWAFGKFAVYPGNNIKTHLKPFTEGALKLKGKTGKASAVMPYYTISYHQAADGTNLGNGFSHYFITDLLRKEYAYDGVLCTDWGVTKDEGKTPDVFAGKPWGVEDNTVSERHFIALEAGMDQFGGNDEMQPIVEAYQMAVGRYGETVARKHFEESTVRLLLNIFRLGLFENPYIDPQESMRTVGNAKFMQAGYDAQVKSIVMLKNRNQLLPAAKKQTVYIPQVNTPAIRGWWGQMSESQSVDPVNMETVKRYYQVTNFPEQADFAIVFVANPQTHADGGGYDIDDRQKGGNGYVPITLQYAPYTATEARENSIASGDPVIDPRITNRSYKGKTVTALNSDQLDVILRTRELMGEKPVVVVVNASRPMVFNEFESKVDAILVRFGVSEQAVFDIISGKNEPSGLLPVQMPANMGTVERQNEDMPFDMECHVDTEGHAYDFAYGLNWNGVIADKRTAAYKKY